MDQAWHRRIMGWVNNAVASATSSPAGIIPHTPTSIKTEAPYSTQPPLHSGFGPMSNLYSTDRQYPGWNYGHTRSRSVSPAGPDIQHGSNSNRSLRSVRRYDEASIPYLSWQDWGDGRDTGNTDRPIIISRSKPPSRDKDLNCESKSPPDNTRPLPRIASYLPAPAVAPLRVLPSSEDIPAGDVDHKVEGDSNKSQELIKLTKLLSLAFGDDISPDVPPSEDELKTWHMTKELWQELQTDIQLFWDPFHPQNIAPIVHNWNATHFFSHKTQIALCQEFSERLTNWFSLYLFSSEKPLPSAVINYYGPLPTGIWLLDIFNCSPRLTVGDPLIPPLRTEGPLVGRPRPGARKFSLLSSNSDISVSSRTSEKGVSILSPQI